MTYWVYKMPWDAGAAPHVRDGLLSLAICKREIRAKAQVGDVLFGFSGRSRKVNRGERLIYIAEVTQKLDVPGEYYERAEFRDRWDCIYDRVGEKLVWRPGSLFHEDDPKAQAKDVGTTPPHARAVVLLSDDFRYLGDEGTMDHASRWPNLATFVYEIGIGHREVDPASEMGKTLTALRRQVWRTRKAEDVGPPTEPPSGTPSWTAQPRTLSEPTARVKSCTRQTKAVTPPAAVRKRSCG